MPHFIRLVKFTEKGLTEPILFKSRAAEFREGARKQGIKIIAEYATLGRYDLVSILEAPDLKSVMKLSVSQALKGRTRVETLTAVPADEFQSIVEEL